ncbi:MAG: hypothetical protein PHQ40_12255 [Anaerolineaceae bacterium]|nr:hypothetical protein [Anaerolineaceae bacterium]
MSTPIITQSVNRHDDTLFWAGIALAVGAFGVFVTSIFYGLSPIPAALPIPNPSLSDAVQGMLVGRATLLIAGRVGIIFDIVLAAATLLLMVYRSPAGLSIERMGWALVTISVLTFVLVDSLSAGVLTQLAALDGAIGFAGFKLLFDTLFILGAISFGLGAIPILISEMKSEMPVLARPFIWVGLLTACLGLGAGLLYFANVSLPLVVGVSIAGGSFIFGLFGIQIARSSRPNPGMV